MKYAWEKSAKKQTASITEHFSAFGKNGRLEIVGLSVVNHATGEAALIEISGLPKDIIGADMAQDILGDAKRHYARSVKHIWPT